MGVYRIFPLIYGWITRDKANFTYQRHQGEMVQVPVMGYYVTDGQKRILVDDGGLAPDGVRYEPYFRTREESPEYQLLRLGVKPEEIDTVVLTHLHWDHASNNDLFPNANFYVQKAEMEFAENPPESQKSLYDYDLLAGTDFCAIDGDLTLYDGVDLIFTPGHSGGGQSVIVSTDDGKWAIVGDVAPLQECWTSVPKIPCGRFFDLEAVRWSLGKIARYADRVLTGHEILR